MTLPDHSASESAIFYQLVGTLFALMNPLVLHKQAAKQCRSLDLSKFPAGPLGTSFASQRKHGIEKRRAARWNNRCDQTYSE
jgi:hypothetical protein